MTWDSYKVTDKPAQIASNQQLCLHLRWAHYRLSVQYYLAILVGTGGLQADPVLV